MSTYDNSGSLSRNQRKEKENHPDFKGKATIGGVEYWVSGWTKKNENGSWLSLSFSKKDDEKKQEKPQQPVPDDFDSDSIPF